MQSVIITFEPIPLLTAKHEVIQSAPAQSIQSVEGRVNHLVDPVRVARLRRYPGGDERKEPSSQRIGEFLLCCELHFSMKLRNNIQSMIIKDRNGQVHWLIGLISGNRVGKRYRWSNSSKS
jgi:hypothetical protein